MPPPEISSGTIYSFITGQAARKFARADESHFEPGFRLKIKERGLSNP